MSFFLPIPFLSTPLEEHQCEEAAFQIMTFHAKRAPPSEDEMTTDKAAFPVGNQALFGNKLGFIPALAMYLDTNEYRISCVSGSFFNLKGTDCAATD